MYTIKKKTNEEKHNQTIKTTIKKTNEGKTKQNQAENGNVLAYSLNA
mgnify:CR=1 FL=1